MLAELNVIEGPYVQDILKQPEALERSLEELHEAPDLREFAQALAAGRYKRVVLTGMGSSLYALYPLHLTLTDHGFPSLYIETAELIHYLSSTLDAQTLVVAVSQSGRSVEVLRLLEMTQGRAHLIGVTNDAESPLAERADARILIRAGVESTVSCKTYVASLLALEWLAGILTGKDLATLKGHLRLAAPAAAKYLADWRMHVAELSTELEGVKQMFVTGRGSSLSAAETAGLILKESTRFAAEGMSSAAFRHGPFESLGPHVLVMVFGGDARSAPLNRRLAEDISQARGKSLLVSAGARTGALRIPQVPDLLLPVVEILPVQMMSLALAARSGREAGRFELATKVTSVE